MNNPLALQVIDIDDKDIAQTIKSSLVQFKNEKEFNVLVFPVISKSMEIKGFVPLTDLPFFICELERYLDDETLIQKAINSARITLENYYDSKKNKGIK
jgi:hypothetical protein